MTKKTFIHTQQEHQVGNRRGQMANERAVKGAFYMKYKTVDTSRK